MITNRWIVEPLFPFLTYRELGILTQVNRDLKCICSDEMWWKQIYTLNFPDQESFYPNLFWKERYRLFVSSREIPVFQYDQMYYYRLVPEYINQQSLEIRRLFLCKELLVYVDRGFNPVIINYPDGTMVKVKEITEIRKVVSISIEDEVTPENIHNCIVDATYIQGLIEQDGTFSTLENLKNLKTYDRIILIEILLDLKLRPPPVPEVSIEEMKKEVTLIASKYLPLIANNWIVTNAYYWHQSGLSDSEMIELIRKELDRKGLIHYLDDHIISIRPDLIEPEFDYDDT